MDMVGFSIDLDQIGFEVGADLFEDSPHGCVVRLFKNIPPEFGDKHQMDVKVENAMPACSDLR